MEPQLALRDGFSRWLDDVVTARRYVPQGSPLDPYETSLRRIGLAVPWLAEVERGEPLSAPDPGQVVTDLTKAQLVTGHVGALQLTDLGAAVVAGWRDLEIDTMNDVDEIARAAVLLRKALALSHSSYRDMFTFWCELTALQPADYWFSGIDTLYLPSYLNWEDSRGYNPFRVLAAINAGRVGTIADWKAWADSQWEGRDALARFVNAVAGKRRGGRLSFCRAMEAYRLARLEPAALPPTLRAWEIPYD